MKSLYFCSLCWLVMATICLSENAGSITLQYMSQSGKRIKEEFTFVKEKSSSVVGCAVLCARNTSCLSASYDNMSMSCHMSSNRVSGPDPQRLVGDSACITLSKQGCFKNWIKIGGNCYLFPSGEKTHSQAKDYCETEGGKLVEPQTNETFELLRNYVTENIDLQFIHSYHFGLTDITEDRIFVWSSSGLAPMFTAWEVDYPLHRQDADCAYMYKAWNFRWADDLCDINRSFICEQI